MKIVNVVGTRPNFMKIAPLIREMRTQKSLLKSRPRLPNGDGRAAERIVTVLKTYLPH